MTTATCPHCNRPIILVAPNPVGLATYDAPGLPARLAAALRPAAGIRSGRSPADRLRSTRARYEHTAAAPWADPDVRADGVRPPPTTADKLAALSGTRRTTKDYRPLDPRADVLTPLAWGIAGGTGLFLTSIPITIWQGWPWYAPLAIWPAASTILYFIAGWRILWDASAIAHEDETTINVPPVRAPGDASSHVRPPPRVLEIHTATADRRRQALAELPDTPAFWALARACALDRPPAPFTEATAGRCALPIDVAAWQHPDQMGFRQIRDLFIRRGWAHWKNPDAHQQGVQLNAAGRAILRNYAAAPAPEEDT